MGRALSRRGGGRRRRCEEGGRKVPAQPQKKPVQGLRRGEHLRTQPQKEQVQAVWRYEHLRAPARTKPVQAMRRVEHLRAQPRKKEVQAMRRVRHLQAQPQKKQLQGLPAEKDYCFQAGQKSGDTAGGRLGVAVVSRLDTVMGLCVLRGSRGREGGREYCSSLLASALGAQA